MINESSLPFTTEFGDSAAYIEPPNNTQWADGVEPEYTLPAAWWNYFMNLFTRTNVQTVADIDSVLDEMKSVLAAAGVTVNPALSNQLLTAIRKLGYYYDLVIDSDAKLVEWLAGSNFKSVLVKTGTWTMPDDAVLNLSSRGTYRVQGEVDSRIVFHCTADNITNAFTCIQGEDYDSTSVRSWIRGLWITCGVDSLVEGFNLKGIYGVNEVSNCRVGLNPHTPTDLMSTSAIAISECNDVHNCEVEINGYAPAAGAGGITYVGVEATLNSVYAKVDQVNVRLQVLTANTSFGLDIMGFRSCKNVSNSYVNTSINPADYSTTSKIYGVRYCRGVQNTKVYNAKIAFGDSEITDNCLTQQCTKDYDLCWGNVATMIVSGNFNIAANLPIGTKMRIASVSGAVTVIPPVSENINGASSVAIPALGLIDIEKVSTTGWINAHTADTTIYPLTAEPDTDKEYILPLGPWKYNCIIPKAYLVAATASGPWKLTIKTSAVGKDTVIVPISRSTVTGINRSLQFAIYVDTEGNVTSDDFSYTGLISVGVSFNGNPTGITYQDGTVRVLEFEINSNLRCAVNGYIQLTSKGVQTGVATLDGLPFKCKNTNPSYSPLSLRINAMTYTGMLQAFFKINSYDIIFEYCSETGTVSDVTNANFTDTSRFMISGQYTISL